MFSLAPDFLVSLGVVLNLCPSGRSHLEVGKTVLLRFLVEVYFIFLSISLKVPSDQVLSLSNMIQLI